MIYLECREQKYATITIVLYGLCSEHFLKKGLFLFFSSLSLQIIPSAIFYHGNGYFVERVLITVH